MRRALPVVACLCGLVADGSAHAAALSSEAQQQIRAATFEVVQLKPDDQGVTYDRPLPLELIPYRERSDKYRSVGTAFAVGPNRYVTAGHVLDLGNGSLFGPPAMRDTDGRVYAIDRVWKYSAQEDFAEFSLQEEPPGARALMSGAGPALNDAVFAVGDALGEGIVIRDGVYTSSTPEELNGAWKWLRFSAAASPGNSGGPLINQSGRVIGLIVRKSEAENLNYAVPIERVEALKEGEGRIDQRAPMRVGIIDASETIEVHERVALPMPLAAFYDATRAVAVSRGTEALHALLEHNRERLFPDSAGSSQLLHSIINVSSPMLVHENSSRIWIADRPHADSFQLDQNGFVEVAGGLVRLRVPDNISLGRLYSDPRLFMDLLLKGFALRRQVGGESVRVTSLGEPRSTSAITDRYGRNWQLRVWGEPWADILVFVLALPTPEGYDAVVMHVPAPLGAAVPVGMAQTIDYIYAPMLGNLRQWQDFLAQTNAVPEFVSALHLDLDPATAIRIRSAQHFELNVTPDLIPLSRDSLLWMGFNYVQDGGRTVMYVSKVAVAESAQKKNWVVVTRRLRPEKTLPDSFQSEWHRLVVRETPWDGKTSNSGNGTTRIGTTADQPAGGLQDCDVLYGLTLDIEGTEPQGSMELKLRALQGSFKSLEH